MRLGGAYVTTLGGRNKDCAAWVSSLTNEEPLVVVKASVDIVGKVVRKDCSNSCNGVIGEGEAALRRGGHRGVYEGSSGAENGDVGCDWGLGGRRRSEIFSSGGGDEDIVGVDGNVLVERGEKKGVEDFLGDLGRSGRHRWWA